MDHEWAAAFAARWERDWNARDVEALLAHMADDVVFTSPVAARTVPGGDGVVRGKDALRAYWTTALARVPDLRFTVVAVYVGVGTLAIAYRNQRGQDCCEVLELTDGVVTRGHGTYAASPDAVLAPAAPGDAPAA